MRRALFYFPSLSQFSDDRLTKKGRRLNLCDPIPIHCSTLVGDRARSTEANTFRGKVNRGDRPTKVLQSRANLTLESPGIRHHVLPYIIYPIQSNPHYFRI
jgi:hypothetical protein